MFAWEHDQIDEKSYTEVIKYKQARGQKDDGYKDDGGRPERLLSIKFVSESLRL
jgi:hypothetical protein